MHHPILYSTDAKGNIREWWIEASDVMPWYRTYSGLQNGEKAVSGWTICESKNVGRSNETTPTEQRDFEVKAEYEKKVKRKYVESVADLMSKSETYFRPMLAHSYDDHEGLVARTLSRNEPLYSQPKLDGMRCIAKKDGLFTREGQPIKYMRHIEDALIPYFGHFPNAVFDGELYNHAYKDDFNSIISFVKKGKGNKLDTEESLAGSRNLIEYHIYDMYDGELLTFSQRGLTLAQMMEEYTDSALVYVPTTYIENQDELDEEFNTYLDQGYEGQIVRIDQPYQHKRTKFLLKRKKMVTEEFRILDIEEGTGNWGGYAKAVRCQLPDGRDFGAGLKGDQDFAREVLENKADFIGGTATVRYLNLTPDGVPRGGVALALFGGGRDV